MGFFPTPPLFSMYNAPITGTLSMPLPKEQLFGAQPQTMLPFSSYMSQTVISPIGISQSCINSVQNQTPPAKDKQKETPPPIFIQDEKEEKEEKKETKIEDKNVRNGSNQTICKRLLAGEAYKSRNVYKTIVRHMYTYIRKNRTCVIEILQKAGYSMPEVEHAFFTVDYWCNLERENGNRNYAQGTVKQIFATKSIFTIIMRETLYALLHCWEQGKYGKVLQKNCEIYQKAFKKFYDETVSILGQPAQGQAFDL